ncbi:MAG: restriction endonuclease subunit S [Candidatus Limimorpha sp.]
MSKLQELIDRFCPNGVEFKPLGEVCEFQRGDTLSSKDAIEGDVPVMAGGQKPSCYHNVANRSGETIVVAGSGAYAGFVTYWNIPVFVSDAFTVNPSNCMLPKYVFYFLKNNQEKIHATKKGAGVPHVHGKDIAKFLIPVPPIEVQDEIVKILDRFADYAAELQARRLQYEYYRNLLLTFNPSAYGCGTDDAQKISVIARGGHSYEIQWKTMGEIGTFIRGNGLQKKDFTESGVGCIHYGQIYTHYGTFADKTKSFVTEGLAKKLLEVENGDIVLACTSENIEDVAKAVAWLGKETIVTGGHSVVFKHNQNPKYIAYFMQTALFFNQKKKYAYGAKVIDIKSEDLAKILIPIPPLELQEKIVAILDRFETLVNDFSKGLPAEIEAVKARYEYYRNKLLCFKEKPA